MKKLILVMVVMAMVIPMAFADDAKVLPAGVLRTYIVPVYSFVNSEFDAEAEKKALDDDKDFEKVSVFNIGAAVEYGVNDWISAAVQWTPGYTFGGKYTSDGTPTGDVYEENGTIKGSAEVFLGAKFQIVGEKAPVVNDMFRVAVAPGFMLASSFSYDAEEEATNGASGDEFNVGAAKNANGFGARLYADYIFNEMFFFNLYSQFKYFLPVAKESTDYAHYYTAATVGADNVEYGYELTLEAEPHFSMMAADGVEVSAGLPVTYVMAPAPKYDGDTMQDINPAADDTDSYSLYLKPSVSAFMQKLPIPMEFKVGYELPLAGKNVMARNNVVFQIKTYMKF